MTFRDDLAQARAEGFDVLDWLSATDDPVTVTACLIRSDDPWQHRLVHAPAPVESVADLFGSAAWHERETAELFGIEFASQAAAPLFGVGPVLRKRAPLTARVEQPWPGALDPAKPRREQKPPGTPWL